MSDKSCTRCGSVKPLSEFQVRRASADGLTASCKECLRAYDAARYERDWAKVRERQARYRATEEARVRHRELQKAYWARYPEKRAARLRVGNALRNKRLERPEACEACQMPGRLHAHHDDYARPLEVRWLCVPCHEAVHHAMRAPPSWVRQRERRQA